VGVVEIRIELFSFVKDSLATKVSKQERGGFSPKVAKRPLRCAKMKTGHV
jgi:hypothetical protein